MQASTDLQAYYTSAFNNLDKVLHQHQYLWQPRPFYYQDCPWQTEHASLHQALLILSRTELETLQNDDLKLNAFFAAFLPNTCQQLSRFKPEYSSKKIKLSASQLNGIPGRKVEQISAFSAALPKPKGDIVDWCSGKGHLARVLHWHHQAPIHCLEFDKQLCNSGAAIAIKHQTKIQFYHHNVLTDLPATLQQQPHCHVGLHACGQLHIQLLTTASQFAPQIAISPCCYHKIPGNSYIPLSNTAKQAALKLSVDDLHLPQEQTITGGQRIHRLRDKEQLWRLGFDELQRDITQNRNYLPLPSIQKTLLNGSFSNFCQWASAQKLITLPSSINEPHYLNRAQLRLSQTRRLELVRQLFQRPLELWLALDRTLYLFEQGYTARLQQFCSRRVSPRNLLITAERMD